MVKNKDSLNDMAASKLYKTGYRLIDYNTNKDIIRPYGTMYKGVDNKPYYMEGSLDFGKVYDIMDIGYNALMRFGYIVVASTPSKKWYSAQRYIYTLQRPGSGYNGKVVRRLPKSVSIEYDRNTKCARLVGPSADPSGRGRWRAV